MDMDCENVARMALTSNHKYFTMEEIEALTQAASNDTFVSKLTKLEMDNIMKKLGLMLSMNGININNEDVDRILDLIIAMVSCLFVSQCKISLNSSSCLNSLLELFSSDKLQNKGEHESLKKLIDIILVAITENEIKEYAAEAILVKILGVVELLFESYINTTLLKKILFLAKTVVFRSSSRQMLFVNKGGLQKLKVCLELQLYPKQARPNCISPTITSDTDRSVFSSLTWLLDAVLCHNKPVCIAAHKLGLTDILIQCLEKVSVRELEGVISSLVHIYEAEVYTFRDDDIQKMQIVTTSVDFKIEDIGSHMLAFIDKLNCKNKVAPEAQEKYKRGKLSTFATPLCSAMPQRRGIQKYKTSPMRRKTWVITKAEQIIFLQCVKEFGLNMEDIRKVYPFHKDLKPHELYELWRGMWDLP